MKHVAAYLLAVLAGNENPSEADITKVLDSVGIQADSAKLAKFLEEVKGKSVDELLKKGEELLATAPAAGAKSGSGSGSGSSSSGSEDAGKKKAGFSLF